MDELSRDLIGVEFFQAPIAMQAKNNIYLELIYFLSAIPLNHFKQIFQSKVIKKFKLIYLFKP